MNVRLVAASAITLFSLGQAIPAFAEETPVTIDTLEQSLKSLSCENKEGRAIGTCISDALKRIKVLENEFALQYKAETVAWRKEHDADGITKEYVVALKAFNDTMQAKRKTFQEAVRTIRKAFFDQQNVERVKKGEVNTKGSTAQTTTTENDARKACVSWDNDEDEVRVCLRNALQRKALVDKRLRLLREKVKALEEKQKTGIPEKITQ